MSNSADPADVESIDAVIAATYDVISGPAGKKRDWKRERSLFWSGARLIPTATVPGRNDVDLAPLMLDVDGYIERVEPIFAKSGFYEREIARRVEHSAEWRRFGAPTNRVTIQKMPSRSCAGSIASSFSTMEIAGGSCRSIGSTKVRSTRFRKSISNEIYGSAVASGSSAMARADGCRGNILCRGPIKTLR